MLSFGAPGYLLAAGAAAAGVIALHLYARARRPAPLPTARFLPDPPESAVVRARRPSDLLLLLLRVLALLLIGAGFARPSWISSPSGTHRVVLLDLSRAVADPEAAMDSARRWVGAGDTLVAFDSAVIQGALASDSALNTISARPRGSLAAALLAGERAARSLAADSVEMVLVSPLVEEEWDAAVPAVRALWPGPIRLVRVAAAMAPSRGAIELRAEADDPLRATLRLAEARRGADLAPGAPGVRIVRGALGADDLAWARDAGGVLVHWSRAASAARDSIGAVVVEERVVVAPFGRGREAGEGAVIARWADGLAAATERPEGAGCVRDVAFALPEEGDLALRESVQRVVERFAEPCGGERRVELLDLARVALVGGEGAGTGIEEGRGTGEGEGTGTDQGEGNGEGKGEALVLGAAMLFLSGEMLLRRRGGQA